MSGASTPVSFQALSCYRGGQAPAGEGDTWSYSIPANQLQDLDNEIILLACGFHANTAGGKTIRLYIDANAYVIQSGNPQNVPWFSIVRLGRTDANNVVFTWTHTSGTAQSSARYVIALDDSAHTLKMTLQGAVIGDILHYRSILTLFKL